MKTILISVLFLTFSAFTEVNSIDLGSELTLCSANDPQLNQCVKEVGQKLIPLIVNGIKEWNLPQLDPMLTPSATFKQDNPDMKITIEYNNIVQKGISKVILENADVNFKDKVMKFNLRYPDFVFESDYKAEGRIYDFIIKGNGKANISLWDSLCEVTIKFNIIDNYIQEDVVTVSYTFNKMYLDYSNLMVNDDPELSASAGTFINENSAQLLNGFKPELEKFYAGLMKENLRGFFKAVPYNVLFKE